MPELPEVETTRRGLEPLLVGQTIRAMDIRQPRLRWRVDSSLPASVKKQSVRSLKRRGKYLIVNLDDGALLIHLGMSGRLRYVTDSAPPEPHDHYDVSFFSGSKLRFNDPRRFGSLHFTGESPENHWLLRNLGPEPLGNKFSTDYLWSISRGRRVAVKQLLMNGNIVVGVGNIYASEALYRAGIRPTRPAGRIAQRRYVLLVDAVREVLREAIRAGGTTLRDFMDSDGNAGYFQQKLSVYGREGEPCNHCGEAIRQRVIGQRATYYCTSCQR
ncbi:MAG: bifunctional DNA-formamidopyrimidine glycosylase/DNA-(apurinic or apyrimidinic site) lyase [Pseudomonadota bacterium]|nr:bifunctional DNA-formamidopyrimidine glycosylase/DNA-(apurinic or apyrimidinic site) lyase [Pseudomonadota bacterium]